MIQANPNHLRIKPTDERPTVCHVIHALGVGGAEVLVDQMVRLLSDEFRCVVAVLDEIGEIGERLQRDGFIVEHLHRQPGIDRGCARRLREFADREGAKILHAHQYTPFFQAMLSRGLLGRRPVVFTEHGRHFPDLPSRKRAVVNRLMLRSCDRLIGCGGAVRQALIDNEGLPESRIEVIYNGVDLQALGKSSPNARARIRAEFGYEATDFVAVLVARLHELKDHQTALRAIDQARKSIPGLRLLLVGEGDERPPISQTIRERGLQGVVTLAGTRKDIADLLAASDIFLMSSISEGIPLTVIEAMAAHRPVVATAVGGLPELVEHGVTGFLAPPRDHAALAAGLVQLYSDCELRERMANLAARRAEEKFSLDGMLNNYRNVYHEVLTPNSRRSLRERNATTLSSLIPTGSHS
ncbi:MAG TPA: glycosyltransferase [Planctomycetaceae bacterium]|nr:glycosyltransferase [Planctomycetaceae bacterium]